MQNKLTIIQNKSAPASNFQARDALTSVARQELSAGKRSLLNRRKFFIYRLQIYLQKRY